MRNHPEPISPPRRWYAILTSLRSCLSCEVPLHSTTASVDGFCADCHDRAREISDEQPGGEC